MNLILNVDDFGLTRGVNDAVFDLADRGSLSSTTVMVGMQHAADAARLCELADFSIGLHFTLTEGEPVSDVDRVRSLVDADGQFLSHAKFVSRLRRGQVRDDEMLTELRAQFTALEAWVGGRISHIDSHQNIHKQWSVAKVLIRFAREREGRLAVRIPSRFFLIPRRTGVILRGGVAHALCSKKPRRFLTELYLRWLGAQLRKAFDGPVGELYPPSLKKLELLEMLSNANANDFPSLPTPFEIACHPATETTGLQGRLIDKRLEEYQVLRSPQFQNNIRSKAFSLTTFQHLHRT